MLPKFLATIGLAFTAAAGAQTVYSNDFDAPALVSGGVTAVFTGGSNIGTTAPYSVTYGDIRRADGNTFATGMTLSLSDLPAHGQVSLGFVLAFINSWDSRDGSPAPDNIEVWIDGVQKASYTYNNASGSIKDIGGGTLIAEYVQFDTDQFYSDSAVNMATDPGYTFAHSASTLTVQWLASGSGWQFLSDEGYAIDNLSVTLAPVPEPAMWATMVLGLAVLARRRAAKPVTG